MNSGAKLISCSDCGGTVSRQAGSCPHCGKPIQISEPPGRLPGRARPIRTSSRRMPVSVEPAMGVSPSGSTVLIVSIVGLFLACVFCPVAWILGNEHLKKCRRLGMAPDDSARTGRVLGIIGTVLLIVWAAFVVIVLAGGIDYIRSLRRSNPADYRQRPVSDEPPPARVLDPAHRRTAPRCAYCRGTGRDAFSQACIHCDGTGR
jgi:hypothetical protein